MNTRHIFIISDGTGITAEAVGNSLISQFEDIDFVTKTIPYVNTHEKAQAVVASINRSQQMTGKKPLVIATLVDNELRAFFEQSNGALFDVFDTFLEPIEQALDAKSSYTVGQSHSIANSQSYNDRIAAIHFALDHDDGLKINQYDKADVILIGVSRCGKTPSCLYMALQFGVLAANYPFTDDDLNNLRLPDKLRPHKKHLYGLTIEPERLQSIRQERRPNSQYASLDQCRMEVHEVEAMFRRESIPYLNSTHHSIEEIATKVIAKANIKRRIY